jgi:hypothetical protein
MYLLTVTVERIDGYCNQPMLVGDYFMVDGGKIMIPDGKHMCMWALQSMMPIFPLTGRAKPGRCLYALIPRAWFITALKGFRTNDHAGCRQVFRLQSL